MELESAVVALRSAVMELESAVAALGSAVTELASAVVALGSAAVELGSAVPALGGPSAELCVAVPELCGPDAEFRGTVAKLCVGEEVAGSRAMEWRRSKRVISRLGIPGVLPSADRLQKLLKGVLVSGSGSVWAQQSPPSNESQ